MELPLVVGVDGSRSSQLALDWAADEAARHAVTLRLVYASQWEQYEGVGPSFSPVLPPERPLPEQLLAAAAERVRQRAPDVTVTWEESSAEAATVLLDEGRNAFALVVGNRGRGELAGLLLGSVSLAVAARADSPVIVVRGDDANREGRMRRLVLGVEGTEQDSAAAAFAFREAELRGVELLAVHAWRQWPGGVPPLAGTPGWEEDAQQERAQERLENALSGFRREHPKVKVRLETPEGTARRALLDAADAADLLVVGAHRRQGHFGLQLGRINHAVLHHSPCPVAVVPQW